MKQCPGRLWTCCSVPSSPEAGIPRLCHQIQHALLCDPGVWRQGLTRAGPALALNSSPVCLPYEWMSLKVNFISFLTYWDHVDVSAWISACNPDWVCHLFIFIADFNCYRKLTETWAVAAFSSIATARCCGPLHCWIVSCGHSFCNQVLINLGYL